MMMLPTPVQETVTLQGRCCYLQVQVGQIPQGLKAADGIYLIVVQV